MTKQRLARRTQKQPIQAVAMNRVRHSRLKDSESEGLWWRLLAALLAVPIFEASLLLGMYLVYPSRRIGYFFMMIPMWVHGVYVGAAIATGLCFGFGGLTWLLGHLFLTHRENEKNFWVTFVLWGALAGLMFFASRFVK